MEYKEQNNYPKAFAATGVILVFIMALCYFIVFDAPAKPIEGTGGILVNYGTTDAGMGTDYTSTEQPSMAEKPNHTLPTKVTPAPPTEQKTQEDNTDKKIVTQNNEDAPVVASNAKKPSNTMSQQATKTVAKPTIDQNALYKGKTNNAMGSGDGTTNTPGNQGKPTGSTLTNNYNGTGSGNGGDIGLGSRKWVSSPVKPEVHNISGKVVIDWVVDKHGNIVQVSIGRGTMVDDNALIERCLNAVKNARVSADENAPDNQQQHTTFIFKLN